MTAATMMKELICPAAEKKKPLTGKRIFVRSMRFPSGGFEVQNRRCFLP